MYVYHSKIYCTLHFNNFQLESFATLPVRYAPKQGSKGRGMAPRFLEKANLEPAASMGV